METAKKDKGFDKYFDTVVDAMVEYSYRNHTSLADMATLYARMVQTARRIEDAMTKAADLDLLEVKPAITSAVEDAALDLAASATRHYYVEQDFNAADSAGLGDER